jgi:hypothetical protein
MEGLDLSACNESPLLLQKMPVIYATADSSKLSHVHLSTYSMSEVKIMPPDECFIPHNHKQHPQQYSYNRQRHASGHDSCNHLTCLWRANALWNPMNSCRNNEMMETRRAERAGLSIEQWMRIPRRRKNLLLNRPSHMSYREWNRRHRQIRAEYSGGIRAPKRRGDEGTCEIVAPEWPGRSTNPTPYCRKDSENELVILSKRQMSADELNRLVYWYRAS